MKRLLLIFALLGLLATGCSKDVFDDLKNWVDNIDGGSSVKIPNNEIWYTNGSTKEVTELYDESAFEVGVVSNKYSSRNNCWVIKFDDDVKHIGDKAFYSRGDLTSVTIPSSVTSIGTAAFANCSSLKRFRGKFASEDGRALIVDSNLVAFAPAGLATYTIPDGVTVIDDYVFNDCSDLESVVIADSVTAIGERAFELCYELASVVMPENLITIGDYAFADCTKLVRISIPNSVTTIGKRAFIDCHSLLGFQGKYVSDDERCIIVDGRLIAFAPAELTEYTIPDGVTEIGECVFLSCNNLNKVTMSNSVVSLEEGAFSCCANLSQITLSDRLSMIGDSAFGNNYSLSEVKLPNSVVTIGDGAFADCSGMANIDIPNSVTTIGSSAFSFCGSLTMVEIPDSVTTLGDNLFLGCQALESVVFGNGITTVPNYAFCKCDNLAAVTLGDRVTMIGECSFEHCMNLTSITLPETTTAIGERAFYGCHNLNSLYCKALTPPAAVVTYNSWDLFGNNNVERLIYVPSGSVDAYKSADGWKDYANAICGYSFE